MASERRFLTAFREVDTDEAGLILEDDGTVWVVAADGTRSQVGSGGSGFRRLDPATVTAADVVAAYDDLQLSVGGATVAVVDTGIAVLAGDVILPGSYRSLREAFDGDADAKVDVCVGLPWDDDQFTNSLTVSNGLGTSVVDRESATLRIGTDGGGARALGLDESGGGVDWMPAEVKADASVYVVVTVGDPENPDPPTTGDLRLTLFVFRP